MSSKVYLTGETQLTTTHGQDSRVRVGWAGRTYTCSLLHNLVCQIDRTLVFPICHTAVVRACKCRCLFLEVK